jgi:hypothetical protein
MEAKCPHCGKMIDVVGPTELEEDYGLDSNKRVELRKKDSFPAPWLDLGGSPKPNLYLRSDIEAWNVTRHDLARFTSGQAIGLFQAMVSSLSSEDIDRLRETLEQSGKGGAPKSTRKPSAKPSRPSRGT